MQRKPCRSAGAPNPSRLPEECSHLNMEVLSGTFILLDGLPSRVDEPHLLTMWREYYLMGYSMGNLPGYYSMYTHQCAYHSNLRNTHPKHMAPSAELATSSCWAACPKEVVRTHRHVLVMATLCQPLPYVVG